MAFVGLKHPVFTPVATEPSGSLPTYGTGLIVGKALQANVSIEHSDAKLYGDDVIVESDNSFLSGKITVGVDDLSKEAILAWLGSQEVVVEGITVVRDAAAYSAPIGGFGYYRIRRKNGARTIRAFWYYRTQWAIPSEDSTTKGEKIEWQTPSIEGTIMAVDDTTATWRDWADFALEADAVAWLDEHANIGEPASLTALNAAIGAAQALDSETYTSASWVALANALSNAVSVAALQDPSQSRVDAATTALTDATAALVERGV